MITLRGLIAWLMTLAILLCIGIAVRAQEHQHVIGPGVPHMHEGPVGQFYATWMRPDNRNLSCCNRQDCYDTEARMGEDGLWRAKRREDQRWLIVPPAKVEQERDAPDARAHMCAPPPGGTHDANTVFCFVAGAGT